MKRLFSTDTDDGTITVIDAARRNLQVLGKIRVGNGPRGGVKFTRDGRGFVANHAGDTISEIDASEMTEVGRIKVGVAPIGVAIVPGDRYALVALAGEDAVAIVDLRRRRRIHIVQVGREPRHPSIAPDGRNAYVPVSGDDYIARIDISPLAAVGRKRQSLQAGQPGAQTPRPSVTLPVSGEISIPLIDLGAVAGGLIGVRTVRESQRLELGKGTAPYSFAISPDGRYGVAANNQAKYITVVDLSSFSAALRIDVGSKGARGTAFTPDSRRAFVSIEDRSEILVIDLATGVIEGRLAAGPGPRGVLFDPDRGEILSPAFARTDPTGNFTANTISVISLPPGAIASLGRRQPDHREVKVGAGPCSVTMFAQ